MQVNAGWLGEWLSITDFSEALERLTLSGIELESVSPIQGEEDSVFTFKITPNRGDCLSVRGLAREISALIDGSLKGVPSLSVAVSETVSTPKVDILAEAKKACLVYQGRVISGVRSTAKLPSLILERLAHAGVRSNHPVVDILNYVMLELGQPMHAFDLNQLQGNLQLRFSQVGEEVVLLDGRKVSLDKPVLVIADSKSVVALAGVMGNLETMVSESTTDLFLECACFDPITVAATARGYGIHTDASMRFERGVDTTIQSLALERATALILEHCGGVVGPVLLRGEGVLPKEKVLLRQARMDSLLGLSIEAVSVERILKSLGFVISKAPGGWQVEVPSYRLDIETEVDLIEEVGRVFGFEHLPRQALSAEWVALPVSDIEVSERRCSVAMVDRGYHEVITYSFVSEGMQNWADPNIEPKALKNPLTATMAVMRTQVWPSLVEVWKENRSRQQERLKIFEIGQRYLPKGEETVVAGLWAGLVSEPNWSNAKRMVDFFDIKGDVEALLALWGQAVAFEPFEHPALHPGKTAKVLINGQMIGFLGALHPEVQQQLGLVEPVYIFELVIQTLRAHLPTIQSISRFPSIRRDLALLVGDNVSVAMIRHTIQKILGRLLKQLWIFDVYQGQGVASGYKSIAVGLLLQDEACTLVEEVVEARMKQVLEALESEHRVSLRS